ncbi:MAG: hemolysin III family protein [Bdellovibrionales bacterium]|nr:hemolysin III family protein [Bdellovibrionales bacterium]
MKTQAKPSMRGRSHEWAAYLFLILALLGLKTHWNQPLVFIPSLVYHLSLVLLFSTSAVYHRPNWSPKSRQLWRKIDHCSIYGLIGGSLFPLVYLGLEGHQRTWAIATCVGIAVLGSIKSLIWIKAPKPVSAALFVLMSFASIPFLPALSKSVGADLMIGVLIGGLTYILGAVVYALKKPDPVPSVFGYHELFHLLVVIAALIQYAHIRPVIDRYAAISGRSVSSEIPKKP